MLASLDIFNGLQATLTREVTTMRNVGDFSELDAIADGGDMGVFNTEQPVGNSTIGGYGSGFGSKGTNFDSEHLVTAVDDVKKTEDREAIPEWGQTLTGRVDGLEKEMRQGFAGINAKLDKLSGSSQQITTQGTVSPPGTDTGRFG